jgi:hypothetical protein
LKELIGDLKTAVEDDVTFTDTKKDESNDTKRSPKAGMRAPITVMMSPPEEMPMDGYSLVIMGASMLTKEPNSSDSTPSKDKKTE